MSCQQYHLEHAVPAASNVISTRQEDIGIITPWGKVHKQKWIEASGKTKNVDDTPLATPFNPGYGAVIFLICQTHLGEGGGHANDE